jgi:SAM-dependent methyltransferase
MKRLGRATRSAAGPYDRPLSRDVYQHPPRRLGPAEQRVTRRSLFGLGSTPPAAREIDHEALTAAVRAAWERPGSEALMRGLGPVAEIAAGLADVGPGMRVLDPGGSDGNVQRACVGRGAEVAACGLAQVEALPFADGEFDAALACFGVALLPRPELVVRELFRAVRPGGAVVLTAWVPRGLPGRLHELAELIEPLPQGVASPAEWGRQALARQRLAGPLEDLELRTRTVRLRFDDADAAFEPLSAWTALEDSELAALRPDFDRLLASQNNSRDAVEIDARYLIAGGRRRMAAVPSG